MAADTSKFEGRCACGVGGRQYWCGASAQDLPMVPAALADDYVELATGRYRVLEISGAVPPLEGHL